MNPPLDFQQNPVEFVMDALRVARQQARDDFYGDSRNQAVFRAKFDSPTAIALMEDWLRLREALVTISKAEGLYRRDLADCARAALAKQG